MAEITTQDPTEMDGQDLYREWSEACEQLHHPSTLSRAEENRLWDRRRALWSEMKDRCDAEAPECPKCGGQQWAQEFGGPKYCTECDYHPTGERMELIQAIDSYWSSVQSADTEPQADGSADGDE